MRKSASCLGGVFPFMFHVPTKTRTVLSLRLQRSNSCVPSIDVGPTAPTRNDRTLASLADTLLPSWVRREGGVQSWGQRGKVLRQNPA